MAAPQVLNPDDIDYAQEQGEVDESSSALSKIEEADRRHMIETARRYPRSIQKFVRDLTAIATVSQESAAAMVYTLPRAGKQIIGPSIRFAEAVASCWHNLRTGIRVIDVDRVEGFVESEGLFYDCETNYGFALRKRQRIVAKVINADSIQITGDAASSKALRDAILRGVPKALWEPVFNQAKRTAAGDAKSMEQIRIAMLKRLNTLGITDVQIYNALSEFGTPVHGPNDLNGDQILAMQSWLKQLDAGDVTIEDIFGSPLDAEIDALMTQLQWSDTKKRMSREGHKGRREEHLKYLRGLAESAGVETLPQATNKPANGSTNGKTQQPSTRQVCDKCGKPVKHGEDHHCEDALAPAAVQPITQAQPQTARNGKPRW